MSFVEIKINGIEKLQNNLRNYPAIAQPILERAIDAAGAILARHTLKLNPVPYMTGTLLQSFRYKRTGLQGAWYPTVYYAKFVNDGTAPHVITTKSKRVLANRRTGEVFGTKVNHPGTRANPFMKHIAENAKEDNDKLFGEAIDRIVQNIVAA